MSNRICLKLVLMILAMMLSVGVLSGCVKKVNNTNPVDPPVDMVKATTHDGNWNLVLVMRHNTDPLSMEDMDRIKSDMLSPKVVSSTTTTATKIDSSPKLSQRDIILAFGYAMNKQGQVSTYYGQMASDSGDYQALTQLYKGAEDWFLQMLAKNY